MSNLEQKEGGIDQSSHIADLTHGETEEEAGLADRGVADQKELEQVVADPTKGELTNKKIIFSVHQSKANRNGLCHI